MTQPQSPLRTQRRLAARRTRFPGALAHRYRLSGLGRLEPTIRVAGVLARLPYPVDPSGAPLPVAKVRPASLKAWRARAVPSPSESGIDIPKNSTPGAVNSVNPMSHFASLKTFAISIAKYWD